VPGAIVGVVGRHLPQGAAVHDSEIAGALVDAFAASTSRVRPSGIFDWIAAAVGHDPAGALPLLEKLIAGLEDRPDEGLFLLSDLLIAALVVILREADQLGDESLVRRALSLQDAYLRLGVPGMEEMLRAASSRS
jgi:DNA polymerase III delta subunit